MRAAFIFVTVLNTVSAMGCRKCGTIKKSDQSSCCAPGGAWFKKCGDPGDSKFDHTWFEGIKACKNTPTASTTATKNCPKCGITKKSGKPSCCAPGGAWADNCGDPGDSKFDHTWLEGMQACTKTVTSVIDIPSCPKCGFKKKSGKPSCCAPGGAWFNNCGDPGDSKFDHTWLEGMQACAKTATTITSVIDIPSCPKCGFSKKSGKRSCCASGGAWFNNCGDPVESKFDHTYSEGIEACKNSATCLKCGIQDLHAGRKKFSCCGRDGTWFNKCGQPNEFNFEYTWDEGIEACKPENRPIATKPLTEATTTIATRTSTTSSACPKCGVGNAGKFSCCLRGGAWFDNCGDTGDPNFDHTWAEGLKACRTYKPLTEAVTTAATATTAATSTTAPSITCPKCGVNNAGKRSCCFRGGAWFKNCEDSDRWAVGLKACSTSEPLTEAVTTAATATTAATSTTAPSITCPKCGVNKAGKRSCCFRGGAWFKNCEDSDRWAVGLKACSKSEPLTEAVTTAATATTAATSTTAPSITCPKCGVNKAGKRSCCFRGGAWVNNCGDPGDSNFEYSWAVGLKACSTSEPLTATAEAAVTIDVTRKSKKQIMLHYQTLDVPSQNSSQQQNLDAVTGSVDSKDAFNILNLTLFISILLMLLTTETNSVL